MDYDQFGEYWISLGNQKEVQWVKDFLKKHGLLLDEDVVYTMVLRDEENIVATGSFSGRVLKCIAVDKDYQGLGIANKVISHLVSEEYHRGNTHLFIYTKPGNYRMFNDLGFYKIAEVPSRVVLMENHPLGIKNYLGKIKKHKKEGKHISSIVMNGNPFTLGHLYLIEKASLESDVLHIFVVWEDKSSFPAEIRYRLIQEGTKHLPNVILHKGEDYIISSATFPSYFIKEYQDIVETHGRLDLEIFCSYIAPALGITKRFIGQEPYCPVTGIYNKLMKEVLPLRGIEVVEIPRLNKEDDAISASLVRKCIQEGEIHKTRDLVPKPTYDFLSSEAAKSIIESIQKENSRH